MDSGNLSGPVYGLKMVVTGLVGVSSVAPIERMKLLLQCQNEMVHSGRLSKPYNGLIDCVKRTYSNEGFFALWRSNLTQILYTFSSSGLKFALKLTFDESGIFRPNVNDGNGTKLVKNVVKGSAAGAASTVILYSLDYCKGRLACDVLDAEKGAPRQFKGIVDVYRKTLASDGIVGLYRGFVVSCGGVIVYRGMYFGLYDTLRPVVISDDKNFLKMFVLGYGVTLAAVMVAYPLDTIRRRMMMRSCEPVKYTGALDCARQVLKNEGFMSLMKGYGTMLLKSVAGAGLLAGYSMME